MYKFFPVWVEKSLAVFAFPISAGSLLKSSAASFLKALEVGDDAISGAELDLKFLVFSLNNMSIYLGFC